MQAQRIDKITFTLRVIFSFCLCFLAAAGCSEQPEQKAEVASQSEDTRLCLGCHAVELDKSHQLDCLDCHLADPEVTNLPADHKKIAARPAHPDMAGQSCGGCHEQAVQMVAGNPHYRLGAHINLVRRAFGAESALSSPEQLEAHPQPEDPLQLSEDLLRRRCLRCHVYHPGDEFKATARATGCAACHLDYENGRMTSHAFLARPGDGRCLSCHYSNHVGFDYYGRYEHDYNEEYRTPYLADKNSQNQFGVEYHQLEADIHQLAGMVCIDCHNRDNVMGSSTNDPQCCQCHDPKNLVEPAAPGIVRENDRYLFTSASTGLVLQVPVISHPAHKQYENKATCQACHARWTFNDGPTHLMRIDHEDLESYSRLSLDGSSEVQRIISSHIEWEGEALSPEMSDKFSGSQEQGIWLKGFGERRWEQVLLVVDEEGLISPGRPIMDLRLSWIDEDERVRFDNLTPPANFLTIRPYTPHTTGHAGLFYEERLRIFSVSDEQNVD